MSDINTYADEAAIAGLSPINGDLVLNKADSSLYLCTNADATGIARWKKFANDEAIVDFESINFATDNDITPGTEQEIAALTGYDIGTYALNSDGSAFYVYDGSDWNIFNSYN